MKKLLALLAALAISLPAWAANPMVEMKTNFGPITIELYPDKAPKTVANFLQYARDGFCTPGTASTTAPSSTASSTAS